MQFVDASATPTVEHRERLRLPGPLTLVEQFGDTTANELSFAHALSLRLSREPLIEFVGQIDRGPAHAIRYPHRTKHDRANDP